MEKQKSEFVSIRDIIRSKEHSFDLEKSTLHYWSKIGLIAPTSTIGRMDMFAKKEVMARIKKIKELKKKGLKLEEIKNILDGK